MSSGTNGMDDESGKKLYEIISDKLTDMIIGEGLKPGDRLPSERALMQMFDVGRPAIREALLVLHNNGLVALHNGRRAQVRQPDADMILSNSTPAVQNLLGNPGTLRDLFFARLFLEKALARHAALDGDAQDMRALKRALEESDAALGDRERYERADIAFHRVLFNAAGNPVFVVVHRALDVWLTERWRQLDRPLERDQASHAGHVEIFESIAMRDADAAERAMEKHLTLAWEFWQARLGA